MSFRNTTVRTVTALFLYKRNPESCFCPGFTQSSTMPHIYSIKSADFFFLFQRMHLCSSSKSFLFSRRHQCRELSSSDRREEARKHKTVKQEAFSVLRNKYPTYRVITAVYLWSQCQALPPQPSPKSSAVTCVAAAHRAIRSCTFTPVFSCQTLDSACCADFSVSLWPLCIFFPAKQRILCVHLFVVLHGQDIIILI